jgi:ribonucleoside-triphosphate reductase (thioredoxin)
VRSGYQKEVEKIRQHDFGGFVNMMTPYQEFIFYRTYARWIPDKGRRETWEETVDRYLNFVFGHVTGADKIPTKVRRKAEEYIKTLNVMPSMRALWSAGENARRDNAVFYNCSFLAVDSIEAFGESLYLLACGCGVGYSVESQYVNELPTIQKQKNQPRLYFKIPDSRQGWKQSVDFGVKAWFGGRDVDFDYTDVRPAGTPLKISGGYASGPEPLRRCLEYMRDTVLKAQDRKLTTIEASDIMNEIANAIVVGGVRRSSQIALSDVNDDLMKRSKHGEFHPRRYMANVSAVYSKKPDVLDFAQEFIDMAKSGSGERGLFNLYAAKRSAPKRRLKSLLAGSNPCAEIVLRNLGLCNLTEVVIRAWDDEDSVRDKITTAVWLGVIQSCFTEFPHLRPQWKTNAEEERLLGVSLTGLADNIKLATPEVLRMWKKHAVRVSRQAADIMGIAAPAAVTTVKPSGTVSQMVDCSSGMHSRYSEYFIRRVRISGHDPLLKMMIAQGFKAKPAPENNDTFVLEFPIKAPEGCKTSREDKALAQLEWYKMLVENWAEHNVSCTIYVREEEWLDVTKFVYDHFDVINGVSFFPHDNSRYEMAPYEEIDKETYEKMITELPKIDFTQLAYYENSRDNTTGGQTLACAGNNCEFST